MAWCKTTDRTEGTRTPWCSRQGNAEGTLLHLLQQTHPAECSPSALHILSRSMLSQGERV